ncbi:23742_t:CDS:2, partial [Gigaspora margarita]
HGSFKCSNEKWSEYVKMPQVYTNETPSEWMKWIWERLTHFRENNLLSIESKKYLKARKLIQLSNSSSYASEIGIAICFSCNQLVYIGQRKKNIGNYNHIGIEKHWKFSCTGNKFCNNAIKKIKCAREIGKKIQAVKIIQQKWLEYFYRPDSMYTTELAQHYQLLWAVREEMRQVKH